jgi:hypothetical protein
MTIEISTACNNTYPKGEVLCSKDSFVVNQTLVFQIKFCGKSLGIPVYIAYQQDENVFGGQFMQDCVDLIGEDLVNEAWDTKLAEATLDYGQRLMTVADRIANENNLQFLKDQRLPPDIDESSIESKLHIVYSLAKWLIFYGKNGHGYEADF